MTTLRLNILEEHALDIIRGLEKLRAVEVIAEEESLPQPEKKLDGTERLKIPARNYSITPIK